MLSMFVLYSHLPPNVQFNSGVRWNTKLMYIISNYLTLDNKLSKFSQNANGIASRIG
jgi:hypothetical protein